MHLVPYRFFDPPVVLDTAVTPIPASTAPPLQIIADSGIIAGIGISFIDNTGALVGVYVGAVGFEELICVIGSGISGVGYGEFPRHSRVSVRSMINAAVTAGTLVGALVTQ